MTVSPGLAVIFVGSYLRVPFELPTINVCVVAGAVDVADVVALLG